MKKSIFLIFAVILICGCVVENSRQEKYDFSDDSETVKKEQREPIVISDYRDEAINGKKDSATMSDYVCPGFVKNALCYYGTEPLTPLTGKIYTDERIEIRAEYPEWTVLNEKFLFTLFVKNIGLGDFSFDYFFFPSSEGYSMISFENFEKADSGKKESPSISIKSGETVFLSAEFIPVKPNIFSNAISNSYFFASFELLSEDIRLRFSSVTPFNEGIECGGLLFPEAYSMNICSDGVDSCGLTDRYYSSKCCNGVFYPGFECCNDNDCGIGSCVDGKCISSYSALHKAVGDKKTLIIWTDQKEESFPISCSLNNAIMLRNKEAVSLSEGIENYYDLMALIYLNESEEFINFDFYYIGPFSLSQLGLDSGSTQHEILNKVEQKCGFSNLEEHFDEIIITGHNLPSLAVRGWSGKPIVADVSLNTIIHELAHNFGCNHINNYDMGTTLQWGMDLMGYSRRHDVEITPTLQVCRGEMGWYDINKDGKIEVLK